ncbi:hypothetical protein KSD_08390 [Ktedonobacter sp. SOSP1-85]|nr:hypothetical protein KSD_08390 [Ktedonobacter sp. SOSP1-85]
MFARYRIVRALGGSLISQSYAAEDSHLGCIVTLKVMHPWPALPNSARYQFFHEMQDISLIVHPQLTALLDYGDFEGRLYATRTYFAAGSLLGDAGRAHFQAPMLPQVAIKQLVPLAQALHNLHTHGYIHGALTFSNVLLNEEIPTPTETTSLQVADAGFTYFAQHVGGLQPLLLPATAAPEQWHRHYSPACDQYALAILLYFWLAGRLPFIGRPQEVLRQKQFEIPPSLLPLNPHVTRQQETILHRALDPNPERRYSTMLAFVQALEGTLFLPNEFGNAEQGAAEMPETTVLSLDLLKEIFAASEKAKAQAAQQDKEQQPEEIVPAAPELSQFERLLASLLTPSLPVTPTSETTPTSHTTPLEPMRQAETSNTLSLLEMLASSHTPGATPAIEQQQQPEPQPRIEPDIAQPIPPAAPEPVQPPVEPEPTHPQPQEPSIPAEPQPTQPAPEKPTEPVRPQPQPEQPTPSEPVPTHPQPQQPSLPTEPNEVPEPKEPRTEPLAPEEPVTLPQPEPDIPQPLPTPPLTPPPGIQPVDEPQPEAQQEPITELDVQEEVVITQARFTITSPYTATPIEIKLEPAETITLGRAGSSDILLEQDNLTSRHHALLKCVNDQFVLFDQRSAKGVFINGRKLTSGIGYPLHHGDNIQIGRYSLLFQQAGVTTPQTAPLVEIEHA